MEGRPAVGWLVQKRRSLSFEVPRRTVLSPRFFGRISTGVQGETPGLMNHTHVNLPFGVSCLEIHQFFVGFTYQPGAHEWKVLLFSRSFRNESLHLWGGAKPPQPAGSLKLARAPALDVAPGRGRRSWAGVEESVPSEAIEDCVVCVVPKFGVSISGLVDVT